MNENATAIWPGWELSWFSFAAYLAGIWRRAEVAFWVEPTAGGRARQPQQFSSLAGQHHHHHISFGQLAGTCWTRTWAQHELPFATLLFGALRTLLRIENRLCDTEKERDDTGVSEMGLWWREEKRKALPLALGSKTLGNHTDKTVLVSIFEPWPTTDLANLTKDQDFWVVTGKIWETTEVSEGWSRVVDTQRLFFQQLTSQPQHMVNHTMAINRPKDSSNLQGFNSTCARMFKKI